MNTIAKCMSVCTDIIMEDLKRFQTLQDDKPGKPLPPTDARVIKDYLSSLATAYRAAPGEIPDDELQDMTDDELKQAIMEEVNND